MATKKILITMLIALLSSTAIAAEEPQDLVDYVMEKCEHDLNAYCDSVTPGNRRLLACLYAHEDKIQTQCTTALFDAAMVLEIVFSKMRYVAHECMADIEEFCDQVPAGEGRIAQCLKTNEANISDRCKVAFNESFKIE